MFRCVTCSSFFPTHLPVCTSCFASHSLLLVGRRPPAAIDGEAEVTNARELLTAVWKEEPIPAYSALDVRHGALIVLVGLPSSGKSTMVTRALDSIRGPVLLQSVEEPGGPTLAMRLARVGAKRPDLFIASHATVDQVAAIVRDKKCVALAIDSVQRSTYSPRELRHLLLALPSLSMLFAVSQATKDGEIRGTSELRHEADVVLEVAALRWTVSKSRYQPAGTSGWVIPPSETDNAEAANDL